jgi:hypothetical protein
VPSAAALARRPIRLVVKTVLEVLWSMRPPAVLFVKLLMSQPVSERIVLNLVLPMFELDDEVGILQAFERIGRAAPGKGLVRANRAPESFVKEALKHNAAKLIFAHVHPSGIADPSHADELITRRLRDALALVDIKVLDHIIVAGGETTSFAERGLL